MEKEFQYRIQRSLPLNLILQQPNPIHTLYSFKILFNITALNHGYITA